MSIELKDIVNEEGVKDLPFGAKARFARALKAERLGDNVTAAIHLDEAIASESQS